MCIYDTREGSAGGAPAPWTRAPGPINTHTYTSAYMYIFETPTARAKGCFEQKHEKTTSQSNKGVQYWVNLKDVAKCVKTEGPILGQPKRRLKML